MIEQGRMYPSICMVIVVRGTQTYICVQFNIVLLYNTYGVWVILYIIIIIIIIIIYLSASCATAH